MPLFHQLRFGFAGRLAAFYAALFVLTGVQLPFLPVWLKAKGLDAELIGVALAVPMLVRWWRFRWRPGRPTGATPCARALMLAGVAQPRRLWAARVRAPARRRCWSTYALVSFAFTPVMPLADTYALRGLAAQGAPMGRCGCGARRPSSPAASAPGSPATRSRRAT